jgi:hypothetical protein
MPQRTVPIDDKSPVNRVNVAPNWKEPPPTESVTWQAVAAIMWTSQTNIMILACLAFLAAALLAWTAYIL